MATFAKDIRGETTAIDTALTALFAALVAIGWLMIYAAGHKLGYENMEFADFMLKTPVGKQTIFVGACTILTLLILTIDEKFWRVFAFPIYAFGIVFLLSVLLFGKTINGAKAWFIIGGFGLQPVEIAKLGTCLALATFISSPSTNVRNSQAQLNIMGILAVPMILIMLQPDPGSMLVFLSFSIMFFREGLSATLYLVAFGLIAVFILALVLNANELVMYLMMVVSLLSSFFITGKQRWWQIGTVVVSAVAAYLYFTQRIEAALGLMLVAVLTYAIVHSRRGRFRFVILTMGSLLICATLVYGTRFVFNNLKKHHQDRINIWLNIGKVDLRGAAYNLNNSKMAIGSGGLSGKGFLEGTMTKLSYVPEQHSDYIFCTIGEEHGFIGTFAVIAIYVLFLIRIVQIAERQRSNFVRLYAYGIAGIFFFHIFINIGMTMGILPTIGIPLPFISSGGSSLLGFTAMIAILLKLDSRRYFV
jgi:rod shape determining protein RodA